jgi:hypothetical protein
LKLIIHYRNGQYIKIHTSPNQMSHSAAASSGTQVISWSEKDWNFEPEAWEKFPSFNFKQTRLETLLVLKTNNDGPVNYLFNVLQYLKG